MRHVMRSLYHGSDARQWIAAFSRAGRAAAHGRAAGSPFIAPLRDHQQRRGPPRPLRSTIRAGDGMDAWVFSSSRTTTVDALGR
jgi:hypothetical protein